jgi:multiple sugar transport system permease protein
MAPIAAIVLPLFILFRYVNLLDSIPGLIVAYLTFNLPFAIWIMNAFFQDLPPSLEEAAMVDGASRFQAFYAFAATFAGPNSQTLPIAAAQLNTQTGLSWGQLTAIGTIVVLPMMIVGLAVRRYLVKGLTLGAVTGE